MNEREQMELNELLMNSSEGVNIQQITELIEAGADVSAVNEFGQTPLHRAVGLGRRETAELLLDRGANVNAVDDFGETPLHKSAALNHREVVGLLLDRGANVNAVERRKWTSLHTAIRSGNREIVELLLDRGANINAVDNIGMTPLHFVVKYSRDKLAKLLLEKGASVNAVDKKGRTPLSIVASDYQIRYYGEIILVGHIMAYAVLHSGTTTKPECIVENNELSEVWDYYQNEMMNIKLSNRTISLYQFLRETDENKLAGYLSDKEYDEIRCSDVLEYISEFPEHTDAIVSQFDKAWDRRDLLDKSKAAIPSQNLDNPSAEQLQGPNLVR